ncbi:vomeronasal type-2 receptor 1-like [Pangasianodon hypophthalmus]|uniref:vomeronasal type-2 receptor 1-like n=1 Tax=Pangasianodon hypophthalmus TaxID=310915 RepID=UPI000EFFEB52|nr:vomeronasal type-2 receptor 1-like [Pangasianodon hypophthalmus]
MFKEGDIMIGGIFPIFNKQENILASFENKPPKAECKGFDLRAFRWTRTMMFAIDEINRDDNLLPNITLGYKILDSCASPTNVLRAALTLASMSEKNKSFSQCYPPPLSAIVAESGSTQSLVVAGALGPFRVPMVSYFSTCECLSDKNKYPTFFRTIPSDYYQAKALAFLVKRFGWTWIGVLQSDNDYGRNGISAFTKEVQAFGVCISFVGTILRTYPQSKILEIVELIKQSTVKVILAFVPEGDLYPLMKEVVKQNIIGIQWIASEAWITADRPSTPEMFKSFGGTIGFVVRKMAMPKLGPVLKHISPYYESESSFVSDFWETIVSEQLKKVHFVDAFGEAVFFDKNGDPPASYEVINWQLKEGQTPKAVCSEICPQGTRKAQIKGLPLCCFDCIPCTDGSISNTTADCITCPEEYWSNERKDSCIMKTTEFLSYIETMGIVLISLSLFGACLAFSTMVIFIYFRDTPIVKANNSELSLLLLLSLIFCFLCPLTFIGKPTVWSCMLRHIAFGITFALCISCILGKTIVVVTAFRATLPGKNLAGNFGPLQQRAIVSSSTVVQIVICIIWLNVAPPFPDKVFEQQSKKIILECNTGSDAAFYAVLGYIGLLAVICLVLAFLARKLPDNFNEAKFITFSMLIFCAVWITFIPAYVSSPGKYTVAVEIFAILSSAFGLLLCIFAPKCYIILIKPERNTRKHVMGKNPKVT